MGAESGRKGNCSNCGKYIPSACIQYTGADIPICFGVDLCVNSIDDVLELHSNKICDIISQITLTGLTVSCLTLPNPLTVTSAITQLYNENCVLKARVVALEELLENGLNIPINTVGFGLNLGCLPINPCSTSGTYTTIGELLQALINQACI